MRKVLLGPLLGAALLPFSLGSSAVADTPMATPDGRITTDLTLPDLSPAPGPVALESTVSTDSALDPVADPSGPPTVRSTDPGDDYLIGLAESERAAIVSGDQHLLGLAADLPIFSAAGFLDLLDSERGSGEA